MPPKKSKLKSKPFSRTKGVQGKRAKPVPTGTADSSSAPPKPPSVAWKRQQNSAEISLLDVLGRSRAVGGRARAATAAL